MGSGWITAAFGLGGVLVGGVVNAGVAMFNDWRAREHGVRSAARLVRTEVQLISNVAGASLVSNTYGPKLVDGLPKAEWDANRQVLADGLKSSAWGAVSDVYTAIDHIEIGMALNMPPTRPIDPLEANDRTAVQHLKGACGLALERLQASID